MGSSLTSVPYRQNVSSNFLERKHQWLGKHYKHLPYLPKDKPHSHYVRTIKNQMRNTRSSSSYNIM